MALNGGPEFPFTEAISFSVSCEDQEEVDRLWAACSRAAESRASAAGSRTGSACPGRSSPPRCRGCSRDPDPARAQRAMAAMLQMVKLDIAALEKAADGG